MRKPALLSRYFLLAKTKVENASNYCQNAGSCLEITRAKLGKFRCYIEEEMSPSRSSRYFIGGEKLIVWSCKLTLEILYGRVSF